MNTIIAPSILSADFSNLRQDVASVSEAGADWIHLDVMDGHFVPNLTFGSPIIAAIRDVTPKYFDAHLMVSNPEALLPDYIAAGVNAITFHIEATNNPAQLLRTISEANIDAGIAIKPDTSVDAIIHLIDLVDLVLVMTVEPGKGGQKLIPKTIEKVREVTNLIGDRNINLQVDGGITAENIAEVAKAGANVFVAGSAVFSGSSKDYANNIEKLRSAAQN